MNRIIIFFLLSLVYILGANAQFNISNGSKKVATTMAIIENLYVDEVDEDKLAEDAVKSILEKLDPHSTYISAKDVRDMNDPLEGEFEGIGISFNMLTDTVYVIETISGGPSEKVGLRAGDKIIYANDTLIAGIKRATSDIMSRLKGKKGTKVNIRVLRKGEKELLNFRITRDKIPMHSLDAAYMIDSNIGYIRLSRFGATTVKEFQNACKELDSKGMKNLILDLQGNGGGYLSAAIELSDEFLDKDKLIVYTEGSRHPKSMVNSSSKGSFEKGKLVILIDRGSASASEIVSGATQDWDRGVIVGRRSFGKGLVQRQFPLPDNSMIRLTVAKYFTPTGRSIQRPYTSGDREAYDQDMIDRLNSGELISADSIHFPDSLKYETLINKRTVYGGGGIMPDYYVPVDTIPSSRYASRLIYKGLTLKMAYNTVDSERENMKEQYPTAERFYKEYEVPESLIQKLIKEGEEDEIEFHEEEYKRSEGILKMQIKALIARDLYNTETQIKIINDFDDIYQEGLKIIKNDKLYNELLTRNNR